MGKNTKIRFAVLVGLAWFLVVPDVYADVLGAQQVFFVNSEYDSRGRDQVGATLRSVSERAYLYVADDYWNGLGTFGRSQTLESLHGIGTEFDQRIYPQETTFFGSEPNPGIDDDPRVTLVFADLRQSVGGYFDSGNEFLRSQVPNSNEREIIFLNASQLWDPVRLHHFIAHEFQHLISFNQKEKLRSLEEDIWLNELRSEYAIGHLGYNSAYSGSNIERRAQSFLNQPSDSVTEWKNFIPDYGQVALLGAYMKQHWSPRVVADQLTSHTNGIASINDALARNGYTDTFHDIFTGWMIANRLNDPSLGARYAYSDPGLASIRVAPTLLFPNMADAASLEVPLVLRDWEQRWYDLKGFVAGPTSTLRVSFSGDMASLRIPYVVFFNDGTTTIRTATTGEILIPNVGVTVTGVLLMPYTSQKLSGFSSNEPTHAITMSLARVKPQAIVVPEEKITPEKFGLHEGDFIRAEGDKDIFIINPHGYKRIVLSPKICLQYGHLGARGCFDAVHIVSASTRDAFTTSPYYTNGETEDGKIYQLIETGEDSAYLKDLNTMHYAFDQDGFGAYSVFRINNREQQSYQ
ncbi:MAG: hypothetical protein AAB483_00225 [Patescibacteria group bacterium]